MSRRSKPFAGKHVVITGGSAGIGLALAKLFHAQGACLTLIARTASKLEAAVKEVTHTASSSGSTVAAASPPVQFQVADTTSPEQITAALASAEEALGPVDVLICNAGAADPGYFHEQGLDVHERLMRLNYLGTVATIQAVYKRMIARDSGHICIISSVMGTMGFTGYSSYAPSKYALKGLADCLRNELQGSGVRVSLSFPPDTDTPGLQHENLTKPIETKEISGLSTVFNADQVARGIVKGIRRGAYIIYGPDLGLNLQVNVSKGVMPRNPFSVLLSMVLGFFAPLIQAIYGWLFDRIARKHSSKRFASVKTTSSGS